MDLVASRAELVGLAQRREISSFISRVRELSHAFPAVTLDTLQVLHISVWLSDTGESLWRDLLACGCSPFACDFNGDTTLHYAIRSGNLAYIEHLWELYDDKILSVTNHQNCNLLLTACAETPDDRHNEVLSCLEWLYMRGVSIESQDTQGKTPLLWATQRGSLTITHWLISRGAHLAHRDHMNRTALHVNCSSGNYDVALFLCSKGAVNLIDAESHDDRRINTPFRIAWQRGHLWLAMSLRCWHLMHSVCGVCSPFVSPYAWLALGLLLWNGICGHYGFSRHIVPLLAMRERGELLVISVSTAKKLWAGFDLAVLVTLGLWILASKKSAGCLLPAEVVMPSQTSLCSSSAERDCKAFARDTSLCLIGTRSTQPCLNPWGEGEALRLLHGIEAEAKAVNLEIAGLNKLMHSAHHRRREAKARVEDAFGWLAVRQREAAAVRVSVAAARSAIHDTRFVRKVLRESKDVAIEARLAPDLRTQVCYTCHGLRGPRVHHCRDCGVCTRRFDHHCVWIDNCVGLKNQTPFLLFLHTIVFTLFAANGLFALFLYASFAGGAGLEGGGGDRFARGALRLLFAPFFYLSIANTLTNTLWQAFASFLLFRTTRSMLTDVTFYETMRRSPEGIGGRKGDANSFWDFANLTPVTALLNVLHFLLQTDPRDSPIIPHNTRVHTRKQSFTDEATAPLLMTEDPRPRGEDLHHTAWQLTHMQQPSQSSRWQPPNA